ncbi:hypothetical protein [Roseibacillus ishigakijimensis]
MMKDGFWLALLFCEGALFGEEIREYEPARHDRFVDFPADLAANEEFFLAAEDWSGFGWSVEDPRKHFTLISPRHFVGAQHFRPSPGQEVRFVGRDGVPRTFTIGTLAAIPHDSGTSPSDLFVGELTEAVAPLDSISVVPILNLAGERDYEGRELIVSGKDSRAGKGILAEIGDFSDFFGEGALETRGFTFLYRDSNGARDDVRLVSGDSGGPSVVATEVGFALVGTHSAIETVTVGSHSRQTNFDTFVPHYLEAIDAVLAGQGYAAKRVYPGAPALTWQLTLEAEMVFTERELRVSCEVRNDSAVEARNVRLVLTPGRGEGAHLVQGEGWFLGEGGARRARLQAGESSVVTVAFLTGGPDSYLFELAASLQADGSAPKDSLHSAEVVQSYETWRAANFPFGLPGRGEDSDGDGLVNELEYLLGRRGNEAETDPVIRLRLGEERVEMAYSRPVFAEFLGQQVVLQKSVDLQTWQDLDVATGAVGQRDKGLEEIVLSEELASPQFFRLQVREWE